MFRVAKKTKRNLSHDSKIHFETREQDKYSFETGAVWVVWIFWALWSVGEIVEGRCHHSEIVRTAVTGLFFVQPQMFGERIRLPEALSLPFLFSTVWALAIRLTKM